VRQASLAPQLRNAPPRPVPEPITANGFFSPATPAGGRRFMPRESAGGRFAPRQSAAAESSPTMASPEAARNTMSALQRGWQLGRVEAEQDATSAPGSHPSEPSGPHEFPTTPTTSTTGQARGPFAAGTPSSEPDPADSADQRDEE